MNELTSPKEKAQELSKCFHEVNGIWMNQAIECAIKAVKLILKETGCGNCKEIDSHYWNKVLHELELMKETN